MDTKVQTTLITVQSCTKKWRLVDEIHVLHMFHAIKKLRNSQKPLPMAETDDWEIFPLHNLYRRNNLFAKNTGTKKNFSFAT